MARYVVRVSGKLIQNKVPLQRGDIIELPQHVAEEYGRDLVVPEVDVFHQRTPVDGRWEGERLALDKARRRRAGEPVEPEPRKAVVQLDGQRVGLIEETERGTRFTYDPEWVGRKDAMPVSLTLPVRKEPYESRGVHPFFANLLPEGWLLMLSTQTLKISADDVFGLLLATCSDCIGAVEIKRLAGDE